MFLEAINVPITHSVHRVTGRQFALKTIVRARCQGRVDSIEGEVSILRQVKHANVIALVEELDTPACVYLVMELVSVSLPLHRASSSSQQDSSCYNKNYNNGFRVRFGVRRRHRGSVMLKGILCIQIYCNTVL